ncbi:hypothetical protein [Rubellicoccus peritrichatus]|uniref:Uncharacterized protein n=1 Tax=Rubellicoccus peritrichatus TaxID=3080537 RepID=A0AAQ3QWG1_9BACT|nr:hypothetical protein [Puniceicoccus sp. CR14]WOO41852.1 hypothetical protein RZN69_02045 [Puniceicoccus sp. CR14]
MIFRSLLFFSLTCGFVVNVSGQETPQADVTPETETAKAIPFDEITAYKLLERFVGQWQGSYDILSPDGKVIQEMEAEIIYKWSISPKGRILKGRAIYAAENGIAHANSETFIEDEMIISTVEQGGKTRTYRGLVGDFGKSIAWTPLDRGTELDESLRQIFGRNAEGADVLTTTGYENVQRQGLEAMLIIRGELTQIPLQTAKDGPVHDY